MASAGGQLTAPLLGCVLDGIIVLGAGQELLSAAAGRHVLDAHMNALLYDAVANLQHNQSIVKIDVYPLLLTSEI